MEVPTPSKQDKFTAMLQIGLEIEVLSLVAGILSH